MPSVPRASTRTMCEVSVVLKDFKGAVRDLSPPDVAYQVPGWLGLARGGDSPPSGWDSLPQHILVQILQHVPVQARFRHAALVGVDWAEAAVTATTDVCMPDSRCLNLGNFQSWLVQHSASSTGQSNSLTAISLTSHADQELVLLPCPKLRRLDLANLSVQLLPTAGGLFPGALRGVTALTRFTLQHASVVGGPQTMTALAPLTDLQHLTLGYLETKQIPANNNDWFPVPGSLFPGLVKLTHLEMHRCVASSTLEHLGCLTALQQLVLGRLLLHNTSAAAFSGLDSLRCLEWLCLEGLEASISTSSMPTLGQLTKLTRLQLLNCKGFQAVLLSGMMDLQKLDIQGTPLLGTGGVVDALAEPAGGGAGDGAAAAAAAADDDDAAGAAAAGAAGNAAGVAAAGAAGAAGAGAAGNAAGAAAGAAAGGAAAGGGGNPAAAGPEAAMQAQAQAAAGASALLLELPKLVHLTDLSLVQVLWAHAAGMQPSAYAALTASCSLRSLDLSFSLIPADAWRAIFNPNSQMLTDLRSLNILCSQAAITDRDLSLLCRCCPGLRSLGLKGTLKQGSGMDALLGFTALTSLSVNHVSSDDALAVLAELRGLENLQFSVLSSIRASGLLQLSALKSLTRLRVESSPETWIAKYGMVLLQDTAPPGSPPDVWAQLQRWCLHKIELSSPVTEPPREKVHKSNRVIRWLVRCITDGQY